MAAQTHRDALQTLHAIRRRLADRLAERIQQHTGTLQAKAELCDDPLGACQDLDSVCFGLTRINNAIASLRAVVGTEPQPVRDVYPNATGLTAAAPRASDRPFDKIRELVLEERYEDASRKLAQIVRLPVDRAFTATRFFGRALQNDPALTEELAELCDAIESMPVSQVMKTLIRSFGLQAVESGAAMTALRERRRALSGAGLGAQQTPAIQLQAAPHATA